MLTFTDTRSRNTDGDTSREAAKHAVSHESSNQRLSIKLALLAAPKGLTAREVAVICGMKYIKVQHRISECGLRKTDERRDGCAVWVGA